MRITTLHVGQPVRRKLDGVAGIVADETTTRSLWGTTTTYRVRLTTGETLNGDRDWVRNYFRLGGAQC